MIEPMYDRVVLRRDEKAETTTLESGLIVFNEKHERDFSRLQAKGPHPSVEAVVVARGPGKEGHPVDLEIGDRVVVSWKAGSEVEIEGINHVIARYDEIEALVE